MSTDTQDARRTGAGRVSPADAIETARGLDAGDLVAFENGERTYDEPLTVETVDVVEWRAGDDSSWRTADLELAAANGGPHRVTAVEGSDRVHDHHSTQRHCVYAFVAFDNPDQAWCGTCGDGPMTVRGVKIHNGRLHDGDHDVRYTDPDPGPEPAEPVGDLEPAVVPVLNRVLKTTGQAGSAACAPYHLPDPGSPTETVCSYGNGAAFAPLRPEHAAVRDACQHCVKHAVEHDVDPALRLLDRVEEHAAELAREEIADELPDGLRLGDIHQVADMYGSLDDCAADLDVEPGRAYRILDAHDRLDDVETPPALDLREYASHITTDTIADAVGGAQSVFEAQKGLRVSRAVAKRVLDDIGFYDEVNGHGGSAPTEDEVRERLERFVVVGVGQHA